MLLRTLTTGILLAAGAFAQMSSFPKPSYFRETFNKTQPKVELKDPVRLKDFVVGGKLELSLKNYLALVMSNNTDIQIQMLGSGDAQERHPARLWRVGSRARRRSFNSTRATTPPTSALDGATELKTLSQPLAMSVTQTLPEGINYTVAWGGSKSTSNSTFNNYNPALVQQLCHHVLAALAPESRSVREPAEPDDRAEPPEDQRIRPEGPTAGSGFGRRVRLLGRGFGAREPESGRGRARRRRRSSSSCRRSNWSWARFRRSTFTIRSSSWPPTKSSVAQARFTLVQREDALRKQIGADLDPEVRKLPHRAHRSGGDAAGIDQFRSRAVDRAGDAESPRSQAGGADPGRGRSGGSSTARNALLPNLALTGNYTVNGRGGVFLQRTNVFDQGVASPVLTSIPGGLADALSQMFGFGFSSYQLGLRLTLPIRNRARLRRTWPTRSCARSRTR